MLWKSANKNAATGPSIIRQLTLMFGATTFILLSLAACLLYSVLVNNLNYSDIKSAKRELKLIANMVTQSTSNPLALKQEIIIKPLTLKKHKYYCRIIGSQNKLFYSTPEMNNLFLPSIFPEIPPYKTFSKPIFFKAANHRHYVLSSMFARGEDGHLYQIQLAYDTFEHYSSLKKYRTLLFIILLAGLIICPIICLLIARRGLAPLQKLTAAIGKVQITNLNAPLSANNYPQELLKLIDAFNALMLRLETSFKQLSQFSADLAHELRTPIHNLINNLEITLSKSRMIDDYNAVLLSNLEECINLGNLIDRLLFLARTENPNTAIEKSTIDLVVEINNIIDFFEAAAEEKQITLSYDKNPISLWADKFLLKRVLINLISNALKYTPHKGEIMIRTYQQDQQLIIEIEDTGCGIAPEHLPHIFTRFYRAEFARSKQTGGHGLGLAIVKTIMELHGGKVEVISSVGKGSIFRLVFNTEN